MKLSDIAGVFSRYFVVGFFVPAFFGLAAASLLLTPEILPNAYEQHDAGTRLLIVGGLSIPVGMLLQGFHPALLSGLTQHRSGADLYRFVPTWLYSLMLKPAQIGFERLTRLSDEPDEPMSPRLYEVASRLASRLPGRRRAKYTEEKDAEEQHLRQLTQTTAGSRIEERYPSRRIDLVPTQLGNTLLATQEYAFIRWGLDTWPAWPRLENLLSEQERDSLSESKAEVAFFVNSAIVANAVGILLVIDEIWHKPVPAAVGLLYALPFLVAYAFYRLSAGAAVRWGQYERAAVDLHRLELFEKIGFRTPQSYAEQYRLARALNRFMLYRPLGESGPGRSGETLIIGFTLSPDTGGLQPLPPSGDEELVRLNWQPASASHRVWLETDCVLHGVAFANVKGERIHPHDVIVDTAGIPRRRSAAGARTTSPSEAAGELDESRGGDARPL